MPLYKNRYPSSETLPYGLKGNEKVIDPKWLEKYLADKTAPAQKKPEEILRQNRWPGIVPTDPALRLKDQTEKEKTQPSGLKRKMRQSNIFNFSKDEAFNRMYLDTGGYENVPPEDPPADAITEELVTISSMNRKTGTDAAALVAGREAVLPFLQKPEDSAESISNTDDRSGKAGLPDRNPMTFDTWYFRAVKGDPVCRDTMLQWLQAQRGAVGASPAYTLDENMRRNVCLGVLDELEASLLSGTPLWGEGFAAMDAGQASGMETAGAPPNAIIDAGGSQMVEFAYDAWDNPIIPPGTLADMPDMPGAPFTLNMPDAQEESGFAGEDAQRVTVDDLLSAVMTPQQLGYMSDMNNDVLDMLTDEQKQRINAGEDIYFILNELDPDKQMQINQWAQNVFSSLNGQQKTDLMFLGSGMLDSINLEKRLAILQYLKDSGEEITYDDLVTIGVYAPGTLAEGGFLRWLQNLDVGGPAHFTEILNEEYRLNGYGTSFAALDEECRRQQEAQRTLMFAMAAAPAIDSLVYGPSGVVYGNNAFDNLERQGTTWNFTGSYGYIPSPYKDSAASIRLQTTSAESSIKTGSLDNLPSNAQNSYNGYEGNGWQGNFGGQTSGTAAGSIYRNSTGLLPKTDLSGKPITYKEFDVNNRIDGLGRDAERFVMGSDGSIYYTSNHFMTFTKIR